jgi:hypothetical protein
MATEAKAVGYLELNIGGFDQALKTAKNLFATAVAGFTAYKTIDFFKDGIKDAIDFGKEMQSASRAMGGFDPGKLLLAQKALEKTGMGAEEARGHIGDFIKEGRNVSEIFGGADNYAKALKSAAQDYGSQADVLTRSGKALQTVWNTMEAISSKVRTFFMAMTERFVVPLQAALSALDEIDLAGIGASFGDAISKAATTFYGIFKNGDTMQALKLGLTVAFQEGVNWLVGGLKFIANMMRPSIGDALVKGFKFGVDILWNALKVLFSADLWIMIGNGFVAVGASITSILLKAFDTPIRALRAGMEWAMQQGAEALINKVPGMKKLFGIHGDVKGASFQDIYNKTSETNIGGLNSKDYADAAKDAAGRSSESMGKVMDVIFGASAKGGAKFEKANLFGGEDKDALAKLLADGFKTGTELLAGKGGNNKPTENVITNFSGSSSKVIADNLAKVGGGGNYLKVGQTLAQKTYDMQARATKATEESNAALKKVAKNTEPANKNPTLPR